MEHFDIPPNFNSSSEEKIVLRVSPCKIDKPVPGVISGVSMQSPLSSKTHVFIQQPVSVAIQANLTSFRLYSKQF